ncbi:ABC transporter ATP-binding protein/permease [Morococcus cerebrosus]|uniref:ATP-binding cassette domain-containing protein n=1 Tax=Morococcus cerebrosus TaxID=1056807 RepID=A0A0C1E6N1_9NEIS|nr:ABC transporter ATP-binding protein/permease [Morococcus cerebrosus]KIC07729.1 multidrug ABC transporter ATP-binding protein [Morococcus cerebrosus]OFJ65789.1 ABC transporter [Neisseria sp. HMSC073B07]UNV88295.1 ATP-binding cassette domain-containing protein [Morococcus cerebrosus]
MNTVSIQNLSHRYGKTLALDGVSLDIPKGATVGLIGPDGVGKSTLLSLMAGVKVIQDGRVEVLGGDMADKDVRRDLSHRIAFMPQGLGRNLYPTLSVYENIDFHARLFGLDGQERTRQIARLMEATRLAPFSGRAAGKLSGGMKQKLSLCCALVHSPDLLILDEPTTGVDPLSRRQFWALVDDLRREHAGMTVIVATAYIEEAQRFERLLAMDAGRLLENKPTADVLADYGTDVLEEAYVKMLPPEKQQGSGGLDITPFVPDPDAPPAMEAHGLTKRFGAFTAVDHVSFTIQKGEIFGFLGSNGCGKSTTMKMLTGLLEATEGAATLLGKPIDAGGLDTKMRVGYMSQAFSLYEELSVRRNLDLHARLYQMGAKGAAAVEEALQQFDLADVADTAPASLPLGIRQRLQLAAACLHHPEVLILDEPTSGVDPAARDMFWRHLLKLSREDKITIFVSTHFMNEAARCDRISFMHKGRVLAVGTPAELAARQNAPDLEEAFVQYLIEAEGGEGEERSSRQEAAQSESEQREFRQNTDGVREPSSHTLPAETPAVGYSAQATYAEGGTDDRYFELSDDLQGKDTGSSETRNGVREQGSHTLPAETPAVGCVAQATHVEGESDNGHSQFSDDPEKHHPRPSEIPSVTPDTQNFKYRFSMIWTFARREAKELLRDKIRLFFAVFGPLIIMASVSWGISFDVRNLKFAVYDRDQTAASRELVEYFDGSRYFLQQPPIQSEAEIDTVLKSSGAILVIDIPSGFGRDLARGLKPEVGFYVDGSMPFNATNIRGYIGSLITAYTKDRIAESGLPVSLKAPAGIEPRFMYNQDFNSINAIAPGVMMLVLMMIPAMMSAVGVVREREIGSIANFYASPAAVAQYLIGKQLPYIAVGMVNFAAMMLMIIYLFGVPLKGSFTGLAVGTFLMVSASTALGLLISCFVRSQLAAIFATAIITMIPAQTYSGFLYPLSTMEGGALIIGKTFPSSWYYTVSVGSFTKGLHTADLLHEYAAIATFAATSLILACVLLKKQEK